MVGQSIERAARELQASRDGVETELERLYVVKGTWVLLVLPPSGLDANGLRGDGASEETVRRAQEVAARLLGRQQLVQIAEAETAAQLLDADMISVRRQYVVSSSDAAWLLFTLKKTGPDVIPVLTSVGTKPQ
jgi:hypothetical protein